MKPLPMDDLRNTFGLRLQENVPMAHYTTSQVGGHADVLLPVHTADEMADTVAQLWEMGIDFAILGGGSNVLISDKGIRGLVVLNRARNVKIDIHSQQPAVWAESGANLGAMARQLALRGLSGLEWSAAIPGTVGGAVYGNAGAFGSDIRSCLLLAEILHPKLGKVSWPVEQFDYAYRSSILKRECSCAVILAAKFQLAQSTPTEVKSRIDANAAKRRQTQPPGATIGSMFKNPPGDFAGRLIDAAGLKGQSVGDAEISTIHANFFILGGSATASDILRLIRMAQEAVLKTNRVHLELEIELLGEWDENQLAVLR
ncbi:MAG: UDP-N-acetylmuramate dehydrogenase [Chloroflexi bacterium]|nr:UDP-N-acetylmuramate dehydrogenase [Chloroflexota bacterium]